MILLIMISIAENKVHYAEVPESELEKYDFSNMEGRILTLDDVSRKIGKQIEELFGRFGLEPWDGNVDFKQYLVKKPSGTFIEVHTFGW